MHMTRLFAAAMVCILATAGCTPYHLYQGNRALDNGDLATAEQEYLAAHGSDEATISLAAVRVRQGRPAEVVSLLEPLTKHSLLSATLRTQVQIKLSYAYSELSAAKIRAHRYNEAMDLAQKALTADRTNLYAKANLAISASRRGIAPLAALFYREVAANSAAAELKTTEGITLRALAEDGLAELAAMPPKPSR